MKKVSIPSDLSELESFAAWIKWVSNSTKAHIKADQLLRLVEELRDCWKKTEEYEKLWPDPTQFHQRAMLTGLENDARRLWLLIETIFDSLRDVKSGRISKRTKNPGILAAVEKLLKKSPKATNRELWTFFSRAFQDLRKPFSIEADGHSFELLINPVEFEQHPDEAFLCCDSVDYKEPFYINFDTFRKYVTVVRKNLGIVKNRSPRKVR